MPALPERSRGSAEGGFQVIGETLCAERLKQPDQRTKPAVSGERDLCAGVEKAFQSSANETPIQLCWKWGMGSLDVTDLPERPVPWLADDDVVEHLKLQEPAGLDPLAGHLDFHGAGVGIARGTIVRKSDGMGGGCYLLHS